MADTHAMCQSLAAAIRNIESVVAEVQRDLQHQQEHIQGLREKSVQTYEDVHTLQVGLGDTNINLDKLAKELGRVGQAAQALQGGEKILKEKVLLVEEAQKMSVTKMDAIAKDVKAAKESDRRIEDAVQRQVNEDIRSLRRELANTNLTVNQVVAEQKNAQTLVKENRDLFRDSRVDIERMFDEVKKTNTVTNILENRLASTAKGVQQSWSKTAELSDALVKVMECYDKTTVRIKDAEDFAKDINVYGRKTREEMSQINRQVELNTDRLAQGIKLIDENASGLEEMRHEIIVVRQKQDRSQQDLKHMKGQMAEAGQAGESWYCGQASASDLAMAANLIPHQMSQTYCRGDGVT